MEAILANYCASITELKRSPTKLLLEANGEPIAILNRKYPVAYLVPVKEYEAIIDTLEDIDLAEIIKQRKNEEGVAVSLDKL